MSGQSAVLPSQLVAAAQILAGDRTDDPRQVKRSWQDEAWGFYDDSGPLRYATTWLANLISKARLQAARLPDGGDEPEPITSGPAADVVAALAGGADGQSQMLRSSAIELTVPGLCYLVGRTKDDSETDVDNEGSNVLTWRVYSQDVLRQRSPATALNPAIYELMEGDKRWVQLPDNTLIVKIWRPHERIFWEADSPARAALSSLRELKRIAQYIDAVLLSRLAGAGVLLLPQGASYPTAPGAKDGRHPFITEVMDVMMRAVANPGTASQLVPIPIEVPDQLIDKVRHISFATELSDKILAMRESALQQAAIALDVPAEILTGMGEVNHWGSWQIEESAVKIHAEPLLEIITAALTRGYLIPTLEAMGEDTEGLIIWADTSELTAKPDRSDDAITLYGKGEVGGSAARREAGLSESDKPDDEELARWAYIQMLAHESTIPAGLQGLGIPIPPAMQTAIDAAAQAAVSPAPTGGEPFVEEETEEEAPEEQGVPDTEDDEPFRVAAVIALDAYVFRAMERAGNRIRNNRVVRTGVGKEAVEGCTPENTHVCIGGIRRHQTIQASVLLEGAWDHVKEIVPALGLEPTLTVRCLDDYCISLLNNGLEHSTEALVRELTGKLWAA